MLYEYCEYLNTAEREDYNPSISIFVVKHTKGLCDTRATLSYGFRNAEDSIDVESDEDEEILPEAKDTEEVILKKITNTSEHPNLVMMRVKKKMSLTKSNFSN